LIPAIKGQRGDPPPPPSCASAFLPHPPPPPPLLMCCGAGEWDVIVAHVLGVDHIGDDNPKPLLLQGVLGVASRVVVACRVSPSHVTITRHHHTSPSHVFITRHHHATTQQSQAVTLDVTGHTHGPDHSTMPSKLQQVTSNPKPQTPNPKPQTPNPKPQTPNPKPQMNALVAEAMAVLPPSTLLVVMGDHG